MILVEPETRPENPPEPSPIPIADTLDNGYAKIPFYLFLAAFAVHLIYLSQYANSPFFWIPRMDSLYHDILAQKIVSGTADPNTFFRAPFYYHALAIVYRLFGHSFWAARLVQSLVASVSVVLLYKLGTSLLNRTVGIVAAFLMILYGPLIFAQNELHTTVYELFFTLAFLLATFEARKAETNRRRFTLAAFAGLLLGMAAITRPNALTALPILLFWVWQPTAASSEKSAQEYRCNRRFTAFLLTVFALIPPLLVTLRNIITANDPVFIASQGGINLYLGNRIGADGFTPRTPSRYRFDSVYEDSVELYGQRASEEAVGHSLKPGESQKYWIGQTFAVWQAQPLSSLTLLWKKCLLAITHREIRNNTAFDYVRREWTPILWLTFVGWGMAFPLAVFGAAIAWKRIPDCRPSVVFVPVYLLSFVLFFAADRFRLPVVPVVLLFAGYGLTILFQTLKYARGQVLGYAATRLLIMPIVLLASSAILANVDWYTTETPAVVALDYWSAGNRYIAQSKFADAVPHLEKAIRLDSTNPDFWSGLGETYYYQQQFDKAFACFDRVIELDGGRASAYYNQALCKLATGKPDEAKILLNKAVEWEPNHRAARAELAKLSAQ